jgi:hypothetical protein
MVRNLLHRAAESLCSMFLLSYFLLNRGGLAPPPPTSGAFTGGGYTLDGEDVDSSFVPDPNAHSGVSS